MSSTVTGVDVTPITVRARSAPQTLGTRKIRAVGSFPAIVSRLWPRWLLPGRVGAVLAALLLLIPPSRAAAPAGYTEYLIPFDEDVFVYVTDPLVQATTDPIPG